MYIIVWEKQSVFTDMMYTLNFALQYVGRHYLLRLLMKIISLRCVQPFGFLPLKCRAYCN